MKSKFKFSFFFTLIIGLVSFLSSCQPDDEIKAKNYENVLVGKMNISSNTEAIYGVGSSSGAFTRSSSVDGKFDSSSLSQDLKSGGSENLNWVGNDSKNYPVQNIISLKNLKNDYILTVSSNQLDKPIAVMYSSSLSEDGYNDRGTSTESPTLTGSFLHAISKLDGSIIPLYEHITIDKQNLWAASDDNGYVFINDNGNNVVVINKDFSVSNTIPNPRNIKILDNGIFYYIPENSNNYEVHNSKDDKATFSLNQKLGDNVIEYCLFPSFDNESAIVYCRINNGDISIRKMFLNASGKIEIKNLLLVPFDANIQWKPIFDYSDDVLNHNSNVFYNTYKETYVFHSYGSDLLMEYSEKNNSLSKLNYEQSKAINFLGRENPTRSCISNDTYYLNQRDKVYMVDLANYNMSYLSNGTKMIFDQIISYKGKVRFIGNDKENKFYYVGTFSRTEALKIDKEQIKTGKDGRVQTLILENL